MRAFTFPCNSRPLSRRRRRHSACRLFARGSMSGCRAPCLLGTCAVDRIYRAPGPHEVSLDLEEYPYDRSRNLAHRSCGDHLSRRARGQGRPRPGWRTRQERRRLDRRLWPVPAIPDRLGRHRPRRPGRAARHRRRRDLQCRHHGMRLGEHRTRPSGAARLRVRRARRPRAHRQARPLPWPLRGAPPHGCRHHDAHRRPLRPARHGGLVEPRLHLGLPPVHPARVDAHHRAHDGTLLPVPAPWRRVRRPRLRAVRPGRGGVFRHHVQIHAHPAG